MRLGICLALLLLSPACASAPARHLIPQPHAFVPIATSGPSIQRVSAPTDPVQQGGRIGKADLEQARALLARARNELKPRQWDLLDRKFTAAEQALERFANASKASGQATEVARGAEALAQAERARMLARTLSQVGPLLVGLILLWPSSTAEPEFDSGPPRSDAQREYEARLREVSEATRQLMAELEAQPRAASTPSRQPLAPKQHATALTHEEDDPRCKPIPLPRHLGGHGLHNECADKMPGNSLPGGDVLVNGKNFDALQMATRTRWEVKTDDFEKQSSRSQQFFIQMKLPEIQRERRLAEECGYEFTVGVHSDAHKEALFRADSSLDVVIMDWC